jgi:hypothetical protein
VIPEEGLPRVKVLLPQLLVETDIPEGVPGLDFTVTVILPDPVLHCPPLFLALI